ncbi:GNAT family N-acetyltransferase [Allosphingosinicella sp.]|jgi:GNAT superfamily N-acetyltransferase|uniref:GNAT family N-acetyltransferase n=1 Tax=Allosphingosinicella sp. TaxID=2823234 RepID=UPI002F02A50A
MPPPIEAAAAHGIAYRPEREDDEPFIAVLYASTRAEEVAQTGWPPELQSAFLQHQHQAQRSHYRSVFPEAEWLVIERGGDPIGRLYLRRDGGRNHIVDISLVPAARGQGIGEAIMRDILAMGSPVSIHVEKFNPARHLYLRLGFEPVEDIGAYERMEWTPGAGF